LGDWEEYIVLIAKQIIEDQSPRRLQEVRLKLYELLSHCIPPDVVLKVPYAPLASCNPTNS